MRTNTHETDGGVADWDEPVVHVVEEVARAKDVEPLDLDPLVDAVDPEALNDLVAHARGPMRIEFEYESRTITVRGDGRVHVE